MLRPLRETGAFARIAREHGVNATQVLSSRRLYQQGYLGAPAFVSKQKAQNA